VSGPGAHAGLFLVLLAILSALVLALLVALWRRVASLSQALHDARASQDASAAALQRQLRDTGEELFAQLLSYVSLRDRLDLRRGLPYTPYWSAAPDFLTLIAEHCLQARPATIVECSSGLTTLVLARCCQVNGRGRVLSLEDGAEFAAAARGHLARYGLADHARVIHAGLRDVAPGGDRFRWYALEELPEDPIELLVIDGPSGFIQPKSRYPALPMLRDRIADGCVIFLDDAGRENEREIVARWLAEIPGLEHRYVDTRRGCSVLTYHGAGGAVSGREADRAAGRMSRPAEPQGCVGGPHRPEAL
jgi:predicted O-methyltransferase YrrM